MSSSQDDRTKPEPQAGSKLDALLRLGLAASRQCDSNGGHSSDALCDPVPLDLDDPAQRDLGDFEVLEMLGRGGMACVYRARQKSLDRDVALKLIAKTLWEKGGDEYDLVREARVAARLQHPNIVEVYEAGESEGICYFAMRLVQGQPLSGQVASYREDPRRAAALVQTLAETVEYAHRMGVLHLDLKPGNILLTELGQPLVADFGLSRLVHRIAGLPFGLASGTPGYMAPEQVNEEIESIGAATDVYGLGAILYELLSGRPPFTGSSTESIFRKILDEAPPALTGLRPKIARHLRAICEKCLRKEPLQRYQSASELADDLRRFVAGLPTRAAGVTYPSRLQHWLLREPKLASTLGLIALMLIAVAVLAVLRNQEAEGAVVALAELLAVDVRTAEMDGGREKALLRWAERAQPESTDSLKRLSAVSSTLVARGHEAAARSLAIAWLDNEYTHGRAGDGAWSAWLLDRLADQNTVTEHHRREAVLALGADLESPQHSAARTAVHAALDQTIASDSSDLHLQLAALRCLGDPTLHLSCKDGRLVQALGNTDLADGANWFAWKRAQQATGMKVSYSDEELEQIDRITWQPSTWMPIALDLLEASGSGIKSGPTAGLLPPLDSTDRLHIFLMLRMMEFDELFWGSHERLCRKPNNASPPDPELSEAACEHYGALLARDGKNLIALRVSQRLAPRVVEELARLDPDLAKRLAVDEKIREKGELLNEPFLERERLVGFLRTWGQSGEVEAYREWLLGND